MARATTPGGPRGLLGRLLRHVGAGFVALGRAEMPLPVPTEPARLRALGSGLRLTLPDGADGPPPGHPERLRPDIPLSRQEQRLLHELLHQAQWHGR
ncbi:DUF6059 family protein [Streptomyces sp. NPDC018019]|uniref:DUF6059 family protein n=1 Tax=Streptomyces sp. NPDC018019 TaxID=3365030 RepID=UPI00378F360E